MRKGQAKIEEGAVHHGPWSSRGPLRHHTSGCHIGRTLSRAASELRTAMAHELDWVQWIEVEAEKPRRGLTRKGQRPAEADAASRKEPSTNPLQVRSSSRARSERSS